MKKETQPPRVDKVLTTDPSSAGIPLLRTVTWITAAALVLAVVGLSLLFGLWDRATRLAFFPPDDYFESLAVQRLDFSPEKSEYRLQWKHKYPGTHAISLTVEHPPGQPVASPDSWSVDIQGEISISRDSVELMSVPIGRESFHRAFWGGSDGNGGFTLLRYEVPDDLPLGKLLTCNFVISKGNPDVHGRYGKTRLQIRKASDL